MKLTYTLAEDDVFTWNAHYFKHHAPFWQKHLVWVMFPLLILVLLISLAPIISPDESQSSGSSWIIGVMLGGLIIYYLFRAKHIRKRAVAKMVKNNPQLVGYREMTFSEAGIQVETGQSQSAFKPSGIWAWESSPTHEFVLLSKQVALIIPRRTFEQEEQHQRFVGWMNTYLGNRS